MHSDRDVINVMKTWLTWSTRSAERVNELTREMWRDGPERSRESLSSSVSHRLYTNQEAHKLALVCVLVSKAERAS
jgi:hypothetical protein